eukprot:GGOE01023941.1.p1 GENE.GGOE01023941.1~~GGOE01023941.1.p1  ORF type:complete len:1002 (+),score=277.70 GGOE01023941.1:108-3008(+)
MEDYELADPQLPKVLQQLEVDLHLFGAPPLSQQLPPTAAVEGLTLVILGGSPEERFIHILEGNRQSRGNVFLAISPTWLERRKAKHNPDLFELHLRKGIWCDSGKGYGHWFLATFDPPRRVTYFVNFMTHFSCRDGRDDGAALEENLCTPMSSSMKLSRLMGDKLHTRLTLAAARVAVPSTLALQFWESAYSNPFGNEPRSFVRILDLSHDSELKNAETLHTLRDSVLVFIAHNDQLRKVVIKPSGPTWYGSRGVVFHDVTAIDAMIASIQKLRCMILENDTILVEEFLQTFMSQKVLTEFEASVGLSTTASHVVHKSTCLAVELQEEMGFMETLQEVAEPDVLTTDQTPRAWADMVEQIDTVPQPTRTHPAALRLRVVVARTPTNGAVVTNSVVGVGPASQPLHGDNTMPYEFDAVLDMWGISNKADLISKVYMEAERAMLALIEAERTSLHNRAQTDLIGIDFLLTTRYGAVCPVVIEVNDHDCTDQPQMLEYIQGDLGQAVRPWVQMMLHRSQELILGELDILIIGLGGNSKLSIYRKIHNNYHTGLHMVDSNSTHKCRDLSQNFLHIPDLMDHSRDDEHADKIMGWIRESGLDKWLDGVITWWEDCVPLTAMVRERLGFKGPNSHSAAIAKSKIQTQLKLMEEEGHKDYRPGTGHYAIKTVPIKSREHLTEVVNRIGFPAVVKVDHGSSAFGVKLVKNFQELNETAETLTKFYKDEASHGGCGLSWGCNLLVQEFVGGSEHDVDLVLYEGDLVCAFVTDNGPTRLPYFAETSEVMPSSLNKHQQDQLKTAARLACIQLGLKTGVFNVELKLTTVGPKVIEINARMGGFYIHPWVESIFGVDLVMCAVLTACGLRPTTTPVPPRITMVGLQLFTSQHGRVLREITTLERLQELHDKGLLVWVPFEDHLPEQEEFEEPIGNIGCGGEDREKAMARLETVLSCTQLDCGDVPPSYYFRTLREIGN